ncbi:ABC transporter ATP-binding protein [Nocardioides rubriscoriae]|uniref:ABC transporter ATP-binding protein n=1 Tax=Nocardioides rubriscoriae TaxID=642762 RepID=UPI0011DF2D53|nr:ABC transporter ATP-binding protein [Nocardioides rubriscoriae]
MTALRVDGVSLSYGDRPVLRGVDLTVESGVTAVLGSSGCGKTTLLRVVAGFLKPAAGTVTVAGTAMVSRGRTVPPRRRGIGYVPQEGALFPHLDVAANIGFGLLRSERRGSVVAEMLELVELPADLAHRHPHQLSGGQQQRVALARALAPRPALVLLDEPFSSLDAGLREETGRAVTRAVRASGAAGILVTHDQGEALSLADQVAVMDGGRFRQVATPAEVYLSPADPVVASFIGHATLVGGVVTAGAPGSATSPLGVVALRDHHAPGAVRIAVRSEQVQLVSDDDPAHGARVRVLDVSFFGHDATVRVRVEETGDLLTARTPSGTIPEVGSIARARVVGPAVAFAPDDQTPS